MTDTFLALRAHIYVTLYSYFERAVDKIYNPTIPKGIVHGTYICCLPLALANIRPWPLVQFFEIPLKTKPPTIPFRIVAFTFSTTNQPEYCLVFALFDEVISGGH